MTWFNDILIWLFAMLDGLVYSLVGTIYEILMRISDTTFFNQDTFRAFSTRLYSLLGIFMLFRLSFSLISYTINPDDLFEKSKGVQNLIGRIIMALVLLILTPTIFTRARELQRIILNNSVIESVILGIGANSSQSVIEDGGTVGDSKNTAGTRLSFVLLSTFLKPNPALFSSCNSGMYLTTGINTACLSELNDVNVAKEDIPVGTYIDAAWKYRDITILLDTNLLQAKKLNGDQEISIMDYKYLISTIAGGVVVYILIIFCVDVGIRSIKLGFLELIAPIPIISYISPTASKDGTFNKWAKTCLSTYLDLFIRLAAIYFAVFIFDNINLLTGITNDVVTDTMVRAFVIIGALIFAKQLPDLLKEFLPSMGKDTFNLSWRKKMEDVPIAGKALGALPTGLAAAAGAGVGAFASNAFATKGNIGKKLLSGFAGAGSAAMRGAGQTLSGKKANEIYKNAYSGSAQARERHAQAHDAGATMGGTAIARLQGAVGTRTAADRMKTQIEAYEGFSKNAESLMNIAKSEMIKSNDMEFVDDNKNKVKMSHLKNEKNRLETLRAMDTSAMSDIDRATHSAKITDLETYVNKSEKAAQQAFITHIMNGNSIKADENTALQVRSIAERMQRSVDGSNDPKLHDQNISAVVDPNNGLGFGERMKKANDAITAVKSQVENSREYSRAQANVEAAKRESNAKK